MLNPHAMHTFRAMSRVGATPPLSALAQLGRYQSAGTAPNVIAGGMQNQQAAFANRGLPNPMMAMLAMRFLGGR